MINTEKSQHVRLDLDYDQDCRNRAIDTEGVGGESKSCAALNIIPRIRQGKSSADMHGLAADCS